MCTKKVANELSAKKNLIWSIFITKSLKLTKIFAFLSARAYYKDNRVVINTC
jgi:hypothetical protein